MKVVTSSDHGKFVAGASGVIDEVIAVRAVVPRVVEYLRMAGVEVVEFHEDKGNQWNGQRKRNCHVSQCADP